MSMRHVLVVAWWFPPLTGGGVHRPLQFVRHLVRRGFRVTVLTAVPQVGDRCDPELLAQVPAAVRIVRVPLFDPFRAWARVKGIVGGKLGGIVDEMLGAERTAAAPHASNGKPTSGLPDASPRLRDLLTEAISLPDRWFPWILPATTKASLALRGDEPDLVFSTSPPHSMHLVAGRLRGLFGCPLVLDFRDPWLGNPFRHYTTPFFRRIDAALERRVVGEAAQVVLNTPALERSFRARHPGVTRVRTIPNGFDPDAFADVAPASGILRQAEVERGQARKGQFEIAHFGQIYGVRSGKYLLQALALLKAQVPASFERLKVVFVGSIDGEAAFRAQAQALGVAGTLSIPGSLPHRQSLARQRESDVLLILGPENREPEVQVPGKLYEYFAAARPILTLSRAGGAIAEILDLAGVPYERAEPDDPAAIAAAIVRLLGQAGDPAQADAARAGTDRFRYDRLTDRLIDCFEDAWAANAATVA